MDIESRSSGLLLAKLRGTGHPDRRRENRGATTRRVLVLMSGGSGCRMDEFFRLGFRPRCTVHASPSKYYEMAEPQKRRIRCSTLGLGALQPEDN